MCEVTLPTLGHPIQSLQNDQITVYCNDVASFYFVASKGIFIVCKISSIICLFQLWVGSGFVAQFDYDDFSHCVHFNARFFDSEVRRET